MTSGPQSQHAERLNNIIGDYFIHQNQLFHLARPNGKRMSKLVPRFQQLCVPEQHRMFILESLHQFHDAFLKTYITARRLWYWPNMASELKQFIAGCEVCVRIKSAGRKAKPPLTSLPVSTLFSCLHIDHHEINVSPGNAFKFVLVMVDSFSMQLMLEPCKTTSSLESAKIVWNRWISAHGFPSYIVADRHQGWMSELFKSLVSLSGCTKQLFTTPHRAASNGICELQNKKIIRFLRSRDPTQWHTMLPTIEAASRYMVSPRMQASPFEIMYSKKMVLPVDVIIADTAMDSDQSAMVQFPTELELLHQIVRENILDQHEKTAQQFNKNAKPHAFSEGQMVYLLDETVDKHLPKYKGPYRIERLRDNIALLVHHYTNKQLKSYVHISKLKAQNSVARELLSRRYMAAAVAAPAVQSAANVANADVTPVSQATQAVSTSVATISMHPHVNGNVTEPSQSVVQPGQDLRNGGLQSRMRLLASRVSQVLRD